MNLILKACVFLSLVICATSADAALIRSLQIEGNATVLPGGVNMVSVYFREVATAGETLLLTNPAIGLVNANFMINRSASTGNNNITGNAGNLIFESSGPFTFTNSTASFPLVALTNTPLGIGTATDARILLGTFNVTGGAINDSATFTVVTPTTNDFVFGNNLAVGDQLGSLPSITITAVPEPASFILLMGAASAVGGWRLRRKLGRSR